LSSVELCRYKRALTVAAVQSSPVPYV